MEKLFLHHRRMGLGLRVMNPDKPKKRRKKEEAEAVSAESDTWTLRPDEEIRQLVADAMQATGQKRQTIIFELIREELRGLVAKKRRERQEAEKRILGGEQ